MLGRDGDKQLVLHFEETAANGRKGHWLCDDRNKRGTSSSPPSDFMSPSCGQ